MPQEDVSALVNAMQALSSRLREIGESPSPSPGSGEDDELVLDIANELDRLAVVLVTMHKASSKSPDVCASVLTHDFAQLLHELHSALEDTSDCCDKLEEIQNTSSILRKIKMARFGKLKQLLETLRNKFTVTRTVVRRSTVSEDEDRVIQGLRAHGLIEASISSDHNDPSSEFFTVKNLSDGSANTANLMGKKRPTIVVGNKDEPAHTSDHEGHFRVPYWKRDRIPKDERNSLEIKYYRPATDNNPTAPRQSIGTGTGFNDTNGIPDVPGWNDPYPKDFREPPPSPDCLTTALHNIMAIKPDASFKIKTPTPSEATTINDDDDRWNPFPDTERMQAG